MARVLVVDDAVEIRTFFRQALELIGMTVMEAGDGKECLKVIRRHEVDLVVTDIYMPEKEGLETIRELKRDFPAVKIIAVSGGDAVMGAGRVLDMARALGAAETLKKPVDLDQLQGSVRRVLDS